MASFTVQDAEGDTINQSALGAGTVGDPWRPARSTLDGEDATQGAIADAAVAAGAAGTISAKLRKLTTDLAALIVNTDGLETILMEIRDQQGAIADATVAAGAAGSVSAKLRRVTQGLEDLKTLMVLAAGSNIVGKVGIDQTTPGTTNLVSAGTLDGANVAMGALADASVAAGATGSISAKLRRATQGLEDLKTLIVLAAGTATIGATKDAGPSQTVSWGVSSATVASADMTTAAAVSAAPTGGQKLVVLDFIVGSDTAMRFDFQEETTNVVVMSVYLTAGATVQITPRGKIKLATADKKLFGKASVAGNVRVTPTYYSE